MKKIIILIVIFISCNTINRNNILHYKPISYIYDVYKYDNFGINGDAIDSRCIEKSSAEEHISFVCVILYETYLFKKTDEICGDEDE